ncbi:hypothetical protein EJB05_24472, partial [Eragrostis curvula]
MFLYLLPLKGIFCPGHRNSFIYINFFCTHLRAPQAAPQDVGARAPRAVAAFLCFATNSGRLAFRFDSRGGRGSRCSTIYAISLLKERVALPSAESLSALLLGSGSLLLRASLGRSCGGGGPELCEFMGAACEHQGVRTDG